MNFDIVVGVKLDYYFAVLVIQHYFDEEFGCNSDFDMEFGRNSDFDMEFGCNSDFVVYIDVIFIVLTLKMTIVCIYLFRFGINILDKNYIVECEFLDSKMQFSTFDISNKSY